MMPNQFLSIFLNQEGFCQYLTVEHTEREETKAERKLKEHKRHYVSTNEKVLEDAKSDGIKKGSQQKANLYIKNHAWEQLFNWARN